MSHGAFLRQHSNDPEMASMIMYDYTKANIDPQLKAILDFATKLTRTPDDMVEADVQTLREAG
jgi:alkylhydroperoxidase family enzyme